MIIYVLKSIGMNNDTLHEAVEEDDIKRIRELSTYNHAINLRQKK